MKIHAKIHTKIHTLIVFLIAIISISFLSFGCGKKNKVNTTSNPNSPIVNNNEPPVVIPPPNPIIPPPPPPPVPLPGVGPSINQEMLAQIELVKGRYPCTNNGIRIDKEFYVENPTTANPLSSGMGGNFNNWNYTIPYNSVLTTGTLPTGTINKVYMGVLPSINDLLIVRDIAVADKIVARAITVSLCLFAPIIIPERPIDIRLVSNLTMKANSSCVIGDVQGKFSLAGAAFQSYPPFTNMPQIFTYFPSGSACNAGTNNLGAPY